MRHKHSHGTPSVDLAQLPMTSAIDPTTKSAYRRAMILLTRSGIPFLVGGAYALERYTGVPRHTKDLDLFVRAAHAQDALYTLASAGYESEMLHPHWLGKAHDGGAAIDIIFRSGNGLVEIDDSWFTYAKDREILEFPTRICAPEEIVWSKAYVMERERFDGADIAHLIRAEGARMNWERLLERFGPHWRLLLSHIELYRFIYPSEGEQVPARIEQNLLKRCLEPPRDTASNERVCQGTLLSRSQYLIDVTQWGYADPRLIPRGKMTAQDIARWTAAIAIHGAY
jgi:hypothetical protein